MMYIVLFKILFHNLLFSQGHLKNNNIKQICTTKRLFPKLSEGLGGEKWLLTNSKYIDRPSHLLHLVGQILKKL